MTELLPCPFCGATAHVVPRAVNLVLQKDPSDPKFGVSVICSKCGAESPNVIDEQRAAEFWNRRDAAALARKDALLREALEWFAAHGKVVFAGGGMGPINKMNALYSAISAELKEQDK
jgi:Lar family restriction alleviation protein